MLALVPSRLPASPNSVTIHRLGKDSQPYFFQAMAAHRDMYSRPGFYHQNSALLYAVRLAVVFLVGAALNFWLDGTRHIGECDWIW